MATKPQGWRKEPARHALAAKGVRTTHDGDTGLFMKPRGAGPSGKRVATDDRFRELAQSQELHLSINIPKSVMNQGDKGLMKYFQKRYGLDLDLHGATAEERDESETYQMIYYNQDLRSQCGMYMDDGWGSEGPVVRIVLWPYYWAGGKDYKGEYEFDSKDYYGGTFKKMIKDSDRVVVAVDKDGVYSKESMF